MTPYYVAVFCMVFNLIWNKFFAACKLVTCVASVQIFFPTLNSKTSCYTLVIQLNSLTMV